MKPTMVDVQSEQSGFPRMALTRFHPICYREIFFNRCIAADILKTIFNRSTDELVTLAIVVTIRILLSWSLSKDFELYEKMDSDPKAAL